MRDEISFYFVIKGLNFIESIADKNKSFNLDEILRASVPSQKITLDNEAIYCNRNTISYFDKEINMNILKVTYYKSNGKFE